MRRLQIGMWNRFDPSFWEAYGRDCITGLEISQYEEEAELSALLDFCHSKGLMFGIHAPIFANGSYPRVTSPDPGEREAGYEAMREEVRVAAGLGAEYLLYHYPYPPLLPSAQDPAYWSKPDWPHYESAETDSEALREASVELFEQLTNLQWEFQQRIVLEYDFFGDFGDVFHDMFRACPEIGLVIDVQRMDVHRRAFPDFDPYKWLDEIAPFVYLVHYSNTHFAEGNWRRHLPVLPDQIDDPRYGDAYPYLQYLAERNDRFHVTFEHNPTLVTAAELDACYALVEKLLLES